jgi:hypothetical protein
MRTVAVTLLIFTALTTPALADSYGNARFGYTIDYPAGLFAPQPEAENGDGRHFTALHGGADLAVWGGYNANDQSPDDIATTAAGDCVSAPKPYRLVKPTVVVVSCATANGVLYHKTYIRGDVLTTFELTYPAAEKARWDAVVGKLTLTPAK